MIQSLSGKREKREEKAPFQKNVSREVCKSYLHFVLKYEHHIPMRNPLWYLLIMKYENYNYFAYKYNGIITRFSPRTYLKLVGGVSGN